MADHNGVDCEQLVAMHGSERKAAKAVGMARTTFQAMRKRQTDGIARELRTVGSDIEIRRLKGQLKAANERYNMALQEIEEWQSRVELIEPLGGAASSGWKPSKTTSREGTTAILVETDWHLEERIDSDVVNGMNVATPDILAARVRRSIDKGIEMIDAWRQSFKVDEIYLALLGDVITGYIHEELEESNYLSPTEAIVLAEQLIVDAIDLLLRESGVKKLTVPCCHGNHGRTTKKKRIKTGHLNSFEWLLYKQLERRYAKSRQNVEFRVANGIHNIQEIRGHVVRFHHGDSLKFNGGVGGITIPANKAIHQWNRSIPAALDVFGHWHQFLETWNFVSCGCLIGYSDFALSIKAEFQPPTQTLIFMSRSHGKVAALPIFVREPKQESK